MKKIRVFILPLFLLLFVASLSLVSCGNASKEELSDVAADIYKGANAVLTELDGEGVSIAGNYIISSNPNYNYYNGTNGIEKKTYELYQRISEYCPDSDNYEYIFEVTYGWTGFNISQVYVAEKWDSKKIGGYPTKPESSEWPPYCMYLTNDFNTLQDIADSSGKLNTYDGSAYNIMGGSYGLNNKNQSSLFDLSSFNYYELLDELIEMFGTWAFKLFLIIFVVSLIWCLFGYQIYQVFAALASLLVMSLVGLLASFESNSLVLFAICFVIGIILAVICAKSKGFSAFMLGVMNSLPITAIISMIITQNVKNGLIIGLMLSIVIGVITAVIKKPLIILSSAIGFGSISGTALACMIPNTKLSIVFQVIFICMGIFVQAKIAHGLLESGSLIEYIKGKNNIHLKVADSNKETKSKVEKIKASNKNCCPNCGAALSKDSKFCIKCGYKISVPESTKPSSETVEPMNSLEPIKESKIEEAVISEKRIEPMEIHAEKSESPTIESDSSDSNLSLGSLGKNTTDSVSSGELVINVDKKTENKSAANSHFSSANDFDD